MPEDPNLTPEKEHKTARWATLGGAILLTIALPIAIDQGYLRYNAYALPLLGLVAVLLYLGFVLFHPKVIEWIRLRKLFSVFIVLIVIVTQGILFRVVLSKSQQHVAEQMRRDQPQETQKNIGKVKDSDSNFGISKDKDTSITGTKDQGTASVRNPAVGAANTGKAPKGQFSQHSKRAQDTVSPFIGKPLASMSLEIIYGGKPLNGQIIPVNAITNGKAKDYSEIHFSVYVKNTGNVSVGPIHAVLYLSDRGVYDPICCWERAPIDDEHKSFPIGFRISTSDRIDAKEIIVMPEFIGIKSWGSDQTINARLECFYGGETPTVADFVFQRRESNSLQ